MLKASTDSSLYFKFVKFKVKGQLSSGVNANVFKGFSMALHPVLACCVQIDEWNWAYYTANSQVE